VCASHTGCDEHTETVREILAGVGLTPAALANTADLPLDVPAAHRLLRAGGGADPLHQNCSGKHAGMVATCVAAGWPHADGAYLDPEHPLQRHITGVFTELAGEAPSHIGVDGCGAPAHVFSLVGLARAMAAVVSGAGGDAGSEVAGAMRGFPHLVGGPGRDVSLFMADIPGLVAKDGAEGVYVAALPDGRAVAVKIADGASRARPVVMARALHALGVALPADDRAWHQPVLGHGREVGRVEAAGRVAAL
jgi:L-asparaginase II